MDKADQRTDSLTLHPRDESQYEKCTEIGRRLVDIFEGEEARIDVVGENTSSLSLYFNRDSAALSRQFVEDTVREQEDLKPAVKKISINYSYKGSSEISL